MLKELSTLKSQIAHAAQKVYDEWDQDEEGLDDHYGEGGICDDIAVEIEDIISRNTNFEALSNYNEYDTHTSVYVFDADNHQIAHVDIHPNHYEKGFGYKWTKIPDVHFDASMVDIGIVADGSTEFERWKRDLEY